jgi:hypothetical protein
VARDLLREVTKHPRISSDLLKTSLLEEWVMTSDLRPEATNSLVLALAFPTSLLGA